MKHLGNRTFGRIGIPSLPWGLGTTRSRSYFRKLITPNAAIGYDPSTLIGLWPMDEEAGVISYDHSPENNNGAYTGVTLGQPGIGDGRTSPFFDGANDYNDIYSVAFNADFNPAEGSMQVWRMPFNVGVWTDGNIRYCIHLYADGNNEVRILKAGAANTVFMDYRAGGVLNSIALGAEADTNYLSYGLTWSVGLNEIRGYKAGAQMGAPVVGLGVWVGPLSPLRTLIGANITTPTQVWHGYEAWGAVWSVRQTPAVMGYLGVL